MNRQRPQRCVLGILVILLVFVGCSAPSAPTPVPPTLTVVPSTMTPFPPTVTPLPPSATPLPPTPTSTSTPIPPTATSIPTNTPTVTPSPTPGITWIKKDVDFGTHNFTGVGIRYDFFSPVVTVSGDFVFEATVTLQGSKSAEDWISVLFGAPGLTSAGWNETSRYFNVFLYTTKKMQAFDVKQGKTVTWLEAKNLEFERDKSHVLRIEKVGGQADISLDQKKVLTLPAAWDKDIKAQMGAMASAGNTAVITNVALYAKDERQISVAVPPSGFIQQPSYGDCKNHPQGATCLSYSDGYLWLVYDGVAGWGDAGTWDGKKIEVARGAVEYHHILNTNLVRAAVPDFVPNSLPNVALVKMPWSDKTGNEVWFDFGKVSAEESRQNATQIFGGTPLGIKNGTLYRTGDIASIYKEEPGKPFKFAPVEIGGYPINHIQVQNVEIVDVASGIPFLQLTTKDEIGTQRVVQLFSDAPVAVHLAISNAGGMQGMYSTFANIPSAISSEMFKKGMTIGLREQDIFKKNPPYVTWSGVVLYVSPYFYCLDNPCTKK